MSWDFPSFDFGDLGSRAFDWASEGLKGIPQQLLSPEFLLPAAASAGGLYLQSKALKDAQKRQQESIDQSMADTTAMQVPVTNAVNQMAYERGTPQVQNETTALQRKIGSGLEDYITKANAAMPADARGGRLSTDYTSGLATMNTEEAARRARLNSAFANLAAPTQQQFEQGVRDTGYGSTIANANADTTVLARDAALKAEKAGQPSGGALTIGQLLMQGGGALASNALLKPKSNAFDFAKAAKGMFDVAGGV